MSELGVGKEVVSYCSKCKLSLAAIITVMKTPTTIGKVECKTCKTVQAFKDPSKTRISNTRHKGKTKAKSNQSVADLWLKAIGEANEQSKKYSIKDKFSLGDIVDHPKFGPGIVEKLIDGDKIQIIFRHEIKTLIHNKA